MTARVFVDTNVLVYRHDASEPSKQSRADAWIRWVVRNRSGCLSFQVLQELYAVLTRKVKPTVPASTAQSIVRELASWQPIAIDLALLERAWLVQDQHLVSWWDALIIAAAQTCECQVLLTEDLQHGHEFGTVRVLNPFVSPDRTPEEVLAALAL